MDRPKAKNSWTDKEEQTLYTDSALKGQEMSGKNWVILVAGTRGWENYRDQANVCCAYQIIRKHGIPDDQIVVMMYDDIADNLKNNPKGSIFSVVDDSNVYPSVPKDYTGENVTSKNFLNVLQGNASATAGGKVIRSESKDNIFIYMSGTGQDDKFNFPDDKLFISQFIGAIQNMSDKFSQMVIYVESTNSSSMFKGLSKTTKAYAVTSGDSKPSNWDSTRNVFRSDEFSAALLTELSKIDFTTKAFRDLNAAIAKTTVYKEFGDTTIKSCFLSKFLENQ